MCTEARPGIRINAADEDRKQWAHLTEKYGLEFSFSLQDARTISLATSMSCIFERFYSSEEICFLLENFAAASESSIR
jgi:hypothetical protein